jgi:hypothetical protein
VKPYLESGSTRVFKVEVDDDELVWHRDEEDRTVTIKGGSGWQFQHDDQLPYALCIGDVINIPAMTFHRIIKTKVAKEDLVVEIEKHRK